MSFLFDLQRERRLVETDNLVHRAAHPGPLDLAAGAVFATDNLGQRIAAADAVQKAERVADIALTAGVGADDNGKTGPTRSVSSAKFLKLTSRSEVIMTPLQDSQCQPVRAIISRDGGRVVK